MKKLMVSLGLFVLFSISAKCDIVYYYDEGGGVYSPAYTIPSSTSVSIAWSSFTSQDLYTLTSENGSLTYTGTTNTSGEIMSLEDAINCILRQQQDLIDLLMSISRQLYDAAMSIIRRMF